MVGAQIGAKIGESARVADEAAENIVDPKDAAESAGLVYVSDEGPGITRRKVLDLCAGGGGKMQACRK